jgi:hypothetical protein
MSIITRRDSPKPSSRKPPTQRLRAADVERIQRQRSTDEGKQNPRLNCRVERPERLPCRCVIGRPEPDLDPLPSQHLTPNRRSGTIQQGIQHIHQGWLKVAAALKFRTAGGRHSAPRVGANSPSQQHGIAEKQVPIVSGHGS